MNEGRRRMRGGLAGLAAFAAGVAAGVAAEELLYRRVFGGADPEAEEPLGSIEGETLWIESFDGTRLYAEVFGPADAPAIVFVHGFTLRHDVWHYQVRDLRDTGYRIVVYDARGHGRSDRAAGPAASSLFSAETLAHDLNAVIAAATTAGVVVAGHSMGGMTVQAMLEFADRLEEPIADRLRGLVLVNTTFTAALGAWKRGRMRPSRVRRGVQSVAERLARNPRRLERLRLPVSDLAMLLTRLGFGDNASAAHVRFAQRLVHATPTETLAAAVALGAFDTHASLEKIDVPVLIVAGEKDVLTPMWLAREMADRIPDAELVPFPGTGHMAMLERHREFTELVRRFSERVL